MTTLELLRKVVALDGCPHPAEPGLARLVRLGQYDQINTWAADSELRAAVLYCLLRVQQPLGAWLQPVIHAGLHDSRPHVREYAVTLVALTEHKDLAPLLRKRAVGESESWLAQYMHLVATDLTAWYG